MALHNQKLDYPRRQWCGLPDDAEDKEINIKLKVANQNIIVSISHIKTANKETQDGLNYCETIQASISSQPSHYLGSKGEARTSW